jgi:trehalose-phosphatase
MVGAMVNDRAFGERAGDPDRRVRIDPRYTDAVLFDLDGVITDTAVIHQDAWAELFDAYLATRGASAAEDHGPFTATDYRHLIDGKPRYEGVRDFLTSRGVTLPWGASGDDPSAPTVCGLGNRKQQLFAARIACGVPVFESTVAMVRHLRDAGVRVAVFSASRNCRAVLAAAGVEALFEARVDGVVAEELGLPGKPDPAVLVEAARLLGVRPGRTAVVEDSEAGVTAARAGGFSPVIGVDRTGDRAALLYGCGADVVVGDLAEVQVRSIARRMSTLPDALDSFGQIAGAVSARRPAVFFDFDGTLSPIVEQPDAATLAPGADHALRSLAALCPVAVLSGRDLADIRDRVGIPGLWYAGSHGFEVISPDGAYHGNETAAQAIPLLEQAAGELADQLAPWPGVNVEHKRYAVAVHYRNAAPEAAATVTAAVHTVGNRLGLTMTAGRKVVELRPNIAWDKGKTLEWIVDQIGGEQPLLPIFLGDDLTDEDGFDAVLHDGVGIVVSHGEDGDRATGARFCLKSPDHVREFIERLVAQCDLDHQIDSSPWSFTFDGYLPDEERLREALCAVGNGYRATRGCAPEADAGEFHYPGTYAAGVYNRLTDDVSGVQVHNESLVNLPNWLSVKFRIDGGDWFDVDCVDMLSYRQIMDLRQAELTREFRFRDSAGRTTTVIQRRIAAMHLPHACALETTVRAEDWSGTVEFLSLIDGDVRNSGVERYRALSDDHLVATQTRELSFGTALLVCQTVQSRIPIAVAARTTAWRGPAPRTGGAPLKSETRFVDEPRRTGHDLLVHLDAGESVTVEKMVAIFTGHDHAISEPGEAAARLLSGLGRYDELRDGHTREWAHLWERFDIDFDGSPDALRVVRLHLLHLLQSVPNRAEDLDAGLPARGLHGEAYRGHIFWDELFAFPVLNLRSPANTRALLLYRYRRLPQARRAAREAGYAGAMFPWQSGSDGREESQTLHLNPNSGRWNPDASARAHHIGIAVAYNVWQYYQVTGDLPYLAEYGAEMLAEIARFWVSRAEFDHAKSRYVIRGVIGPDEFHSGYPDRPHDGIDNNAYTNVMAVWVIVRALDALDALALRERLDLMESLGISGRELDHWDEVSRRMYVPFHADSGAEVISQFEGYADLLELDWQGLRERHGDISRLDRILEADNDSVNRYKAAKQADVLMLFYLLSADELRELLARMGYRFAPEQIPATVDYYRHRTSHGSTLSGVVHAWVLARGNRERAMRYFQQVLMSDVLDIQGGTTAEGIHIAAMAGSVDLLQRCFTGLEIRSDRLILNPMWPESLGALRMPICYRGHRMHLTIVGRTAELSIDPSDQPAVQIECHGQIATLTPGTSLRFDPR